MDAKVIKDGIRRRNIGDKVLGTKITRNEARAIALAQLIAAERERIETADREAAVGIQWEETNMSESDLIETREDVLTEIEDETTKLETTTVCGGRYTLQELSDTFWITILDKPSPTPSELIAANKIIVDLHQKASKEKMIAQALKRKADITVLNTILENLDFCRKSLHSMIWSRSIEAKVSVE